MANNSQMHCLDARALSPVHACECLAVQCMTAEVKLQVLRERMAGNKDAAHGVARAFQQQENELKSLAAIQVHACWHTHLMQPTPPPPSPVTLNFFCLV